MLCQRSLVIAITKEGWQMYVKHVCMHNVSKDLGLPH